MSGNRVFIGRLPRGCREQDIENFFRRCGRVRTIMLKRGYAFVDFRSDRDATDAVHDMNGKTMRGERMTVEIASGRPRKRSREQSHRGTGSRGDSLSGSEYQIIVENLSSRISWKDFKDMIRREDIDVVHVDAHKLHKHQGVVKFKTYNDLKRAVKKFQHREIEGRRLEITETRAGSRDRSGSRDSSDRKSSSRKRYRSRSVSSASTSPRPKKKAPTSPLDRAKSKDTTTATKTSSPHRPVTPEGRSSSERSTSRSRGPRLPTVRSSSSSSSGSASPPKTPGSP